MPHILSMIPHPLTILFVLSDNNACHAILFTFQNKVEKLCTLPFVVSLFTEKLR
jgi:hypothetical protein